MHSPTDADPPIDCPWPFYRELRAGPPAWSSGLGYFLVSRYEDIRRVAMDPETFSSNLVAVLFADGGGVVDLRERTPDPVDALATADPPAHPRQRKLLNRVFSAHRMNAWEPVVRNLATALVDSFAAEERVELMSRFAIPLPLTLIARILGLPECDLPRLKDWSDSGMALFSSRNSAEQFASNARRVDELRGYLATKLEERRREPRDDVTSLLAGVRDGLATTEKVAILLQLLIAGNETTASLIGSAIYRALDGASRPARSSLPDFLEEVLRLESPFQGHFRLARSDAVIGGTPIPAGSRLLLLWGSGNRDEAQFADPEALDSGRPDLKAHLGFGEGIHYCLGAPLARLEARVALETLFDRLPELRLSQRWRPTYVPNVMLRRLVTLEVERPPEHEPHASRRGETR